MTSRITLKRYFQRGAIPKESEFAELIDSMLVQDEDSIIKPPNDPLSIKATGAEEALLNFYRIVEGTDNGQAQTTWQIKQKPGERSGLSIHYDGSESRLFLDSDTGNVGIGTTAPKSTLSVAGMIAVGANPVPDYHLSIDPDGPGGILIGHTDEGRTSLHIGINDKENGQSILQSTSATGSGYGALSLNPGGGNVGIGTTEPQTTLHIQGEEPVLYMAAAADKNPVIEMRERDDAHRGFRIWYNSGSRPVALIIQGDAPEAQDGNQVVIERNSGNVGIGTTAPAARLHTVAQGQAAETSANVLRLDSWIADNADVTQGIHLFKNLDNDLYGWKIEGRGLNNNTATLQIVSSQNGDDRVRMTVNRNTGNVGIGTTNPQKRLHVYGGSGALNLLIIEAAHANNSNAESLLDSLEDRTLIIGGPWNDHIYFYWKDQNGNKYRATLQGSSL